MRSDFVVSLLSELHSMLHWFLIWSNNWAVISSLFTRECLSCSFYSLHTCVLYSKHVCNPGLIAFPSILTFFFIFFGKQYCLHEFVIFPVPTNQRGCCYTLVLCIFDTYIINGHFHINTLRGMLTEILLFYSFLCYWIKNILLCSLFIIFFLLFSVMFEFPMIVGALYISSIIMICTWFPQIICFAIVQYGWYMCIDVQDIHYCANTVVVFDLNFHLLLLGKGKLVLLFIALVNALAIFLHRQEVRLFCCQHVHRSVHFDQWSVEKVIYSICMCLWGCMCGSSVSLHLHVMYNNKKISCQNTNSSKFSAIS